MGSSFVSSFSSCYLTAASYSDTLGEQRMENYFYNLGNNYALLDYNSYVHTHYS